MRLQHVLLPALLVATPALAADLAVTINVPTLNVAEYHKPYVAAWVEREDNSVAAQLAVWYQTQKGGAEGEGQKWLKDLRQWWRRGGREMTMPADGITGATRAPGEYTLTFTSGKAPLGDLPAGHYRLVVEAAREVGGLERVTLPFSWPPKKPVSQKTTGKTELGNVRLGLKP
ncbi:MAG: DUF2271 domain-containing protein [Moraxellaceae bacterium]|nr:DUF2271 domain-containing protein [Moraxellaceae bacterium]